MRSTTVDNLWKDDIIADHWRALNLSPVLRNFTLAESINSIKNLTQTGNPSKPYFCNDHDCIEGIFYGPKCNPNNMYTCSTLLSNYPGKGLIMF